MINANKVAIVSKTTMKTKMKTKPTASKLKGGT